jgi:hypothetical protein
MATLYSRPEKQLDQLPGTDHLGDQVEDHHHQRRQRGHRPYARVETIRGDVRESEAAEVTQSFSHQEEDDRPAGKERHHVDVGVVAAAESHRRETEQGCRRHIVAGNCQTVLEAGDAAAGGIEVGGGLGAAGCPVGDAHGHGHEDQEHDDRVPVGGLCLDFALQGGARGNGQAGESQQGECRCKSLAHFVSFCASLMISAVRSSNSPLARRT